MTAPTHIAAKTLSKLLTEISSEFEDLIVADSDTFVKRNIGEIGKILNLSILERLYQDENSYIPLDEDEVGLDFETFKTDSLADYVQLKSGLIVSRKVARDSGISFREYKFPETAYLYEPHSVNFEGLY